MSHVSSFLISIDLLIVHGSCIISELAVKSSIYVFTPSGKSYMEIARRILGENVEVNIPGRNEGFFSKIKSFFSKGKH